MININNLDNKRDYYFITENNKVNSCRIHAKIADGQYIIECEGKKRLVNDVFETTAEALETII